MQQAEAVQPPVAIQPTRKQMERALQRHVDYQRRQGAADPDAIQRWNVESALVFGEGDEAQMGVVLSRAEELFGCPVKNRRAITIHVETGESFETARALDVLGRNRAEFRRNYARLKAAGVPLDNEGALQAYLAEKVSGLV